MHRRPNPPNSRARADGQEGGEANPGRHDVIVDTGQVLLDGYLIVPHKARGLVVFAHGSGSSRFSPRNQFTAQELNKAGLATLLFDLLTAGEDAVDQVTSQYRFDIPLLAKRLVGATDWIRKTPDVAALKVGYFGASTGSGVALIAAAERALYVGAVVSRGGRPDLARGYLHSVKAPTLLIVGGEDREVIALNQEAMAQMSAEKELVIVPGATHLFEEDGALQKVAVLAGDWFLRHLG
jgi:putative phosphoribosyl transferase